MLLIFNTRDTGQSDAPSVAFVYTCGSRNPQGDSELVITIPRQFNSFGGAWASKLWCRSTPPPTCSASGGFTSFWSTYHTVLIVVTEQQSSTRTAFPDAAAPEPSTEVSMLLLWRRCTKAIYIVMHKSTLMQR